MLWSKRLFKSCVIWVVRLPHQPPGASVMLNVPETISQNYQWTILQKFATRCQASLFWVCSIHTPLPSTRQTGSCPLSLFLPARLWEQMSLPPQAFSDGSCISQFGKVLQTGWLLHQTAISPQPWRHQVGDPGVSRTDSFWGLSP